MENTIRIVPKLNYKIHLEGDTYYPVIANIKGSYAELIFYFPDEKKRNVELKARCLEKKYLEHLSISDSEKRVMIFVSKEILGPIRHNESFQFSFSDIREAGLIKDYEKYFQLLK